MPLVLIDRYLPDAGCSPMSRQGQLPRCGDGGRVPARKRTPPHRLHPGHAPLDACAGPRAGVRRHAAAHGLGDRIVVTGEDFSVQNGYLETKLALAREERPTAIFALSNLILLGVVKAVHESGLRIPDDISVVSFDDNMLFNYLDPAITCIGQPTDEIGTLAVKLLIRAIREPGAAPSHLHLPPSLVIRRSVRNLLLWSKRKAHRICSILLSEQTYLYCNVMGYFDNDTFSLQILNQYFIVVGANQVYYIAP